MRGLMMDLPLLVSGFIEYAAENHGETEVVARELEGDIFRYTYARAHARMKRLAMALARLGVAARACRSARSPGTRTAISRCSTACPAPARCCTPSTRGSFPISSSTSSITPRIASSASTPSRCRSSSRSRRASPRSRRTSFSPPKTACRKRGCRSSATRRCWRRRTSGTLPGRASTRTTRRRSASRRARPAIRRASSTRIAPRCCRPCSPARSTSSPAIRAARAKS